MKTRFSPACLAMLGIPALLLTASVWMMILAQSSQTFLYGNHAIRQSVAGAMAIDLALAIRRYAPPRALLRLWPAFPALLALVMILVPVSTWLGCDKRVYGTGWWQRSTGQTVLLLALIFSAGAIVPRYANRSRRSLFALVALMALSFALPLGFLRIGTWLVVAAGTLVLVLFATLPPRRSLPAAGAYLLTWTIALFAIGALGLAGAELRSRSCFFPDEAVYQMRQALVSIHAGGIFGNRHHPTWIPEFHTDFIFAHLGGLGGMAAGILCLAMLGALIALAWRIVARQTEHQARATTAGCAAVLTMLTLIHVGINLGLLPSHSAHLPFLGYGPRFIVFDGLLVGLLLAFDRRPMSVPLSAPDAPPPDAPPPEIPRWAPRIVTGAVCALLFIFGIRIGLLVFNSPRLRQIHRIQVERLERRLARRNQPVRGRVFDAADQVLASTRTMHIVCADPQVFAQSENITRLPELVSLLDLDETELRHQLADTERRYVRLRRDVSPETVVAIRALGLAGCFIETAAARDYPLATPMAHLLGCTGVAEDYRGLDGIEWLQEDLLHAGGEVKLALDADLQTALQNVLEALADETQAARAQIVAMAARTGAIRAAAQFPAAHGEAPRSEDLSTLRWMALGTVFEPGGLLKPLVAASAVNASVLATNAAIDCAGGAWMHAGATLHDPEPLGSLDVSGVLRHSSNIGMAKIGLLLGEQSLHQSLVDWGLGRAASAGFAGAGKGLLAPPAAWSDVEVARIPIGQGCAVTLLQLLRAYSAVFNDGMMAEPTVFAATRAKPEEAWTPIPAEPLRSTIPPETARWLQSVLAKEFASGLRTTGQGSIVHKTFPGRSGYDPDRVQTAFIGAADLAGAPLLVAVWLDEPRRQAGEPNPAIRGFARAVGVLSAF